MGKAKQQFDATEMMSEPMAQDDAAREHEKQKDDGPTRIQRKPEQAEAAHTAGSAAERARTTTQMQQTVGNARTNQAVASAPGRERDRARANISTPLDNDARMQRNGSFRVEIEGAVVTVLPDQHMRDNQLNSDGETGVQLRWTTPAYRTQRGKVTQVMPVAKPTVTIRTRYRRSANPAGPSAYGRGTTREDVQAGTTTLRHHESSHGTDFLNYLRANPLPTFGGAVGMSEAEFKAAVAEYDQAMRQYQADMEADTKKNTDCVGTPASDCAPTATHSP